MDPQQRRLAEELLFSDKKQLSFVKKLYFGVFDSSGIFPFPTPTQEEQKKVEDLLVQVKQFANESINPYEIDRQASIPDHVIQGLGKLGILGLTISKEYGGLGMSQYAYCRIEELLSAHCGSTALFVNVNQSVGLKALILFGTEAQKEKWLAPIASGKAITAFSLTEANAGSDASGIETRAVFDPVRNLYVINGKKQWSTNASIAQVLTVMARTEIETPQGVQDKITAFLVTPDMPGFFVTDPALEKVGMRGTRTTNLEFRNLEVPAENILGPIGGGLRVCLTVLDYGRSIFGATCTGAAKLATQRAIEHAKTRYQFQRPLASFPLVKKKITQMSALTYAMDATTYLTAGLIDAGAEDIMLESAILKVFTSESLWFILYETMQVFGGRSFFTSEPFERMMRDARLNMIGEGANEVLRVFIAAVGMREVGMSLKEMSEAIQHPYAQKSTIRRFFKQLLIRFRLPQIPVQSPLLQQEAKLLSKFIRRFGFAIIRLLVRYREGIVEQQLVLDRIATSVIALYTIIAVLSKLDRDLIQVDQKEEALGADVSVAKFYCHYAFQLLESSLKDLSNLEDRILESVSDELTGVKAQHEQK